MEAPIEKFNRLADGFSAREYRDPSAYYRRRARTVVEPAPTLSAGDSVLDLGCGDGLAAVPLVEHGLVYRGVDASAGMIAAARAHLRGDAEFEVAELTTYEPPAPVDAVTCFRAVQYTGDLRAFFAHVRPFARKKLVFDFSLRDFPRERVAADLAAAGFGRVAMRPFLCPQHHAPGPRLDALLRGLERTGPLVTPVLRRRFTYVVTAARARGTAVVALLLDLLDRI